MLVTVRRPAQLRGTIVPPPDKSISHRALILNAVADGRARVANLSAARDVESTRACLAALGVRMGADSVQGVGLRGLRSPGQALDCGNSGTTMRLLAGLLAAQPFTTTLVGDPSLARRPMDRVTEPLRLMGAHADPSPLRVGGRAELSGIVYRSPVASAQVKSAVLLAGLYATGETTYVEPQLTRNHTEEMLQAMGAPVESAGCEIRVSGCDRLRPLDVEVPGDVSAAAFWLVAGGLHPDAALTLAGVGINASRTGVLAVLRSAGIPVEVDGRDEMGDLRVATAEKPRPLKVESDSAAAVIDELPLLTVAATQIAGTSVFSGVGELRVKESDRIAAMSKGLRAMGAAIEERQDHVQVSGPVRLQGAAVDSLGDHRVAMALAVAGMLADGQTTVSEAECVDVSYPDFWKDAARLGAVV